MRKSVLIVALIATPALAQSPSGDGAARARSGPNNDPNQVVCISQNDTGSLTRRTRICRTRGEWAETRAQTRQTVERVQTFPDNQSGQ